MCCGPDLAAALPYSEEQCCKSREEQWVSGLGRGGTRVQGGVSMGPDCKEKVMGLVCHHS